MYFEQFLSNPEPGHIATLCFLSKSSANTLELAVKLLGNFAQEKTAELTGATSNLFDANKLEISSNLL